MLLVFQKGDKVIDKAFATLDITIKLINETITELEKCVRLLYMPSTRIEKIQGYYYCLLRQIKPILRIFSPTKESSI